MVSSAPRGDTTPVARPASSGNNPAVIALRSGQQRRRFEPSLASATEARHFATGVLSEWDVEAEAVHLVVAELAANCIIHAATPFEVLLRAEPDAVVVEAHDSGPGWPVLHEPADDDLGWRGLFLVDRLARRWGVTREGPAKTVWAEIPHAND